MYCSELGNSLISEQSICNWHSPGQWPLWPLGYIPETFASENILCLSFKCFLLKRPPGFSRLFPPSYRVNIAMLSLALASNVLPVSGVISHQKCSHDSCQFRAVRASVQDKMEAAACGNAREGPPIMFAVLCHSILHTH